MDNASAGERERRFPQFARLPAELRDAIWKAALPRRVIETGVRFATRRTGISFNCFSDDQSPPVHRRIDPQCQMPLLSQVNRESRAVVVSKGRWCTDFMEQGCMWFDPRTDVVLIRFCPRFWGITAMAQGSKSFAALLNNDNVVTRPIGFGRHHGVQDTRMHLSCIKSLGQPIRYLVGEFPVMLAETDVATSGLFGRCEGSAVIVSVQDRSKLRKYGKRVSLDWREYEKKFFMQRRIQREYMPADVWATRKHLLNHLMDDDTANAALAVERNEIEEEWLDYHYQDELSGYLYGGLGADGYSYTSHLGDKVSLLSETGMYGRRRTIFQRDQEWTRRALQLMPRFEMVVLFYRVPVRSHCLAAKLGDGLYCCSGEKSLSDSRGGPPDWFTPFDQA